MRGTSESYTVRRLKRDRPELAQKVIQGDHSVSANAYTVEHDRTGAGRVRVTGTVVDDEGKTPTTRAVVLSTADRCPA